MPLPLKPHYDLHTALRNFLTQARQTLRQDDQIVLAYGYKPAPHATIFAGQLELRIPIPVSPGAYRSWSNWFSNYLEAQVADVASQVRVEVKVLGSKGNLLQIRSGEPDSV